jgi:opacity protein-like surface antigen
VALALTVLAASPARADATAFLGANTTPDSRLARGVAVGVGLAFLGFEFEYTRVSEDSSEGAPSLTTGMANALVQVPFPIFGLQPYATAGAGIYREKLSAIDRQETSFGINTGGGVKVSLIGPLRLRLDYRVLKLGNGALFSPAHRVYAGLNLRF